MGWGMSRYIIRGGKPLVGTVEAQGSKNSAVAILLACIAVKGRVVLHRVPYITDVLDCIEVLRCLGGSVEWLVDGSLVVDCTNVEYRDVPDAVTGRIRASTYIMGAFIPSDSTVMQNSLACTPASVRLHPVTLQGYPVASASAAQSSP